MKFVYTKWIDEAVHIFVALAFIADSSIINGWVFKVQVSMRYSKFVFKC